MVRTGATKIGVESSHSFGDCILNTALLKAISEHYRAEIGVGCCLRHADAFLNIPWISEIIQTGNIYEGGEALRQRGYHKILQITQNSYFFRFKEANPDHSLIDTPLLVGRSLGLPDFDQRPIFLPTDAELATGDRYNDGMPNIAIEAKFNSGQSWATQEAFDLILAAHVPRCRICWLSNADAPYGTPNLDDMLRWTRREAICALKYVDTFYSVGSGFFCAALALPPDRQPKRIVCLWKDDVYRYQRRLDELGWHPNIIWVKNIDELRSILVQTGL